MITLAGISFDWFLIYTLLVMASAIAIRVGVFCLAVEGIFLTSAFVIGMLTQTYILSFFPILLAITAGLFIGRCFLFLTEKLGLEAIITGMSLNLFCMGISSYLGYKLFNSTFLGIGDTNNVYLPLVLSAIVLLVMTFYFFEKSHYRNRFIAVGKSIDAAKFVNIPVIKYRACALFVTSLLSSIAGVFYFVSQHGVGNMQWHEGIGFLAIGVAFVAGNSITKGVLLALILAVFRTIAISLSVSKGGGLGVLIQISPYLFLLFIVIVPPFFRHCKLFVLNYREILS